MVKLCIMHTIIVAVLVVCVLVVNKTLVTPLRVEFQDATTKIESLEKNIDELRTALSDAKAVVIKDMMVDDAEILKQYIKLHTDNLTNKMVDEAAEALVDASWEHKIPIRLAVGIAQAVTGFNTTYKAGGRGILSVSQTYVIDENKKGLYSNYVKNGAQVGCEVLSKMLNTTKGTPISRTIKMYLNSNNAYNIGTITECALEFDLFRYQKYREHIQAVGSQQEAQGKK